MPKAISGINRNQTDGIECPSCKEIIPGFPSLPEENVARLHTTYLMHPIEAIKELRALTDCSFPDAKIWLNHPNGAEPLVLSDGPPCPSCGVPLKTDKARQCFHCGANWHDP